MRRVVLQALVTIAVPLGCWALLKLLCVVAVALVVLSN